MSHESRLQTLTAREAWLQALVLPGIFAFLAGAMMALILLMIAWAIPDWNTSAPVFGAHMSVRTSVYGGMLFALLFIPAVFIPLQYSDLRTCYVRCLECRELRRTVDIEHFRTVQRCSSCQHELRPRNS